MKLKEGVIIVGERPEIVSALAIADQVYKEVAKKELVVTSIMDGKHGTHSLHYKGYAADLRIRDLTPKEQAGILVELKTKLGKDYDVVLEIDHFHIEYDPH
jgi:hypothetical protein